MPKVASSAKSEGGRKKKDANAPKRNLSAYFIFCADERAKVKASNPDLSLGDTAKELGRRWAAVDAATKSKYEKLAAKDKERYAKDKAAYEGGKGSTSAKSAPKAAAGGNSKKQQQQSEEEEESDDE
ncbi:hypothetical protein RvY_11034-5 [Ramazzottius varieornatus]|uniref:HMG box domain-containing protein n=1 Tax=Ramazzottius varieornatus TaxID=947166 RepID=A0A1D1VES0_RAMVA|nr:hypothetical protein RvY_11034-5 [Ramazzottius varieornatus]